MLIAIREKITGWFAYVVVGVIAVPFALWGIHYYFQTGADPVVAEVEDQIITLSQYNSEYTEQQRRLSERGVDNIPENTLRNDVLGVLLRERLLIAEAERYNYYVPDELLAETISLSENLQRDGRFSLSAYQEFLRASRLTRSQYEESMRNVLLARQIRDMVGASHFVLDREQQEYVKLLYQERQVNYARLDPERFIDVGEVSEEEAQKFYRDNKRRFVTRPRVKADYIELKIDDLMRELSYDEAELTEFYENNRDRYTVPEERTVAHILFNPDRHGDEEARARAEKAYDGLIGGAAFSELAAEYSDDSLTADSGGELPPFIREDIDEPGVEEAIFALHIGEFSTPVESRFGIQIFKLLEVSTTRDRSFEDVRDEVEEELKYEEAYKIYNDRFVELETQLYRVPYALDQAAEIAGLEIQRGEEWLTPEDEKGIFVFPEIKKAVFTAEVFGDNNNSELIEVVPGHAIAVNLSDKQDSRQLEYEEAEEDIFAELMWSKALKHTEAVATTLLQQVKSGKPLAVAASVFQAKTESLGFIRREQEDVDPEIAALTFRLREPVAGRRTYQKAELSEGRGYVVLELLAVRDGEVPEESPQLSMANSELNMVIGNLAKLIDIEINQDVLVQQP